MNRLENLENIISAIAIFATVGFYYTYYYLVNSKFPEKYIRNISRNPQSEILIFLSKKLTGAVILGLIPGVIYFNVFEIGFEDFGITFYHFTSNLPVIMLLVAIIVFTLAIRSKTNPSLNTLQVSIANWNVFLFCKYSVGWIIYLIAYEFLFRGILLFECFNSFGFWPAIAINVAIYSAIHMVYGKEQTIGSLLFGSIASYITLTCGTILIPIIMHVSLSLFSDIFSIRYNESLSFIKQKRFSLLQK